MQSYLHPHQSRLCRLYQQLSDGSPQHFHSPNPWGHLLYSRAFTGSGKPRTNSMCTLCLGVGHSAFECDLYSDGPAKRARGAQAGPRRLAPSQREICINFNRGRCLRNDCLRLHVCSVRGCGGPHASLRCPEKRSSPPQAITLGLPHPHTPSPPPITPPSTHSHCLPPHWLLYHPPHDTNCHHLRCLYLPPHHTGIVALTSVSAHSLSLLLATRAWVEYLLRGLTFGVSTDYLGSPARQEHPIARSGSLGPQVDIPPSALPLRQPRSCGLHPVRHLPLPAYHAPLTNSSSHCHTTTLTISAQYIPGLHNPMADSLS